MRFYIFNAQLSTKKRSLPIDTYEYFVYFCNHFNLLYCKQASLFISQRYENTLFNDLYALHD